ncbi:hypothetical protein GCM10012275_44390 [Longimycelium tulufanense]|uniref:HTH cro/C1-type domain-containing protein n=1 Tax=Longimycelium tulufanense TaxID=907463 RepID=A0A8J3FVJ6_9PSEU|nr:helix-turn-helix transcriptional regulator [Longimycelium tulufanense]GGM69098.1 hypothetical protein GCM10012275_44390 [Longimycelium tulufanense]
MGLELGDEKLVDPARLLAARLRALKARSSMSYEALARRSGYSRSALHRYCTGQCVPLEFTPINRLAQACGAYQEESRELQRLWALAHSGRIESAHDTGRAGVRAIPRERVMLGAVALACTVLLALLVRRQSALGQASPVG